MFTLNQFKSIWLLQAGPIPPQILKLSANELKQQFEKTSDIINGAVALLIGFCFFSALTLSGPDSNLLGTAPPIQLPLFQVQTSFQLFLFVGPVTLIALSIYVHIYIEHWWNLLRVRSQQERDAGHQASPMLHPPLFFNLPTRSASVVSVFVLYGACPLTLLFFLYRSFETAADTFKTARFFWFLYFAYKGTSTSACARRLRSPANYRRTYYVCPSLWSAGDRSQGARLEADFADLSIRLSAYSKCRIALFSGPTILSTNLAAATIES